MKWCHAVPKIGDNVRISVGAVIIGSVRVGNFAVIGANAVVLDDVPDRGVVVGNPARLVRYLAEDEIL